MNTQDSEKKQVIERQVFHSGSRQGTGVGTQILQFIVVAMLSAVVLSMGPRWGGLATAGLWLAFSIYWGIAA
jgi:hypothetical protein